MEQKATPFQQKIQGPLRLPVLNENVKSLMNAFANENLGCSDISNIVKLFPEISARLISLANSVWSAPSRPIVDIEATCVRLGISVIKSVSIAIVVASFFDSSRCPNFDAVQFWTKTMLVSEAASGLAALLPTEERYIEAKDAAQTAALLHNLGLLWLADNLPVETDQALLQLAANPDLCLNKALIETTGAGYCEVNAWIAKQWRLPEVLSMVMTNHLDPEYRNRAWETNALVHSCIQMASAVLEDNEAMPDCQVLTQLGIEQTQLEKVFRQLFKKREKIREMADSLFVRKNKAFR
jgi:HD-like signal output (HDOD) protein